MDHTRLEALERSAYRSVVDDGLIDICMGLFVLIMALVFATDIHLVGTFDLPALLTVLIYPIWKGLRHNLVEPRVGFVQLRPTRMQQIRRSKVLILLCFIGLVVGIEAVTESNAVLNAQLRAFRTLIVGLIVGAPMVLAALLLDVKRWLVYPVVLLIGTFIEYTSGAAYGTGWFASGTLIVAIGAFVLMHFLQDHPVHPDLETADA